MGIEEVLSNGVFIGKGRTGRVYKIEQNPETVVVKIFSPNYFAKLWNWFFYKSPHPLSTEAGHAHAYWKRRLAHRLGEYIGESNVHVADAIESLQNGFMSPFIDGVNPTKDEMQLIYAKTQKLEQSFDGIGMPTLSFSPKHFGSRRKNFIVQNNQVYIVDYEQSVPVPNLRGNMGYDVIYFDDVYRFIENNKLQILDKLGTKETSDLNEAFELAKQHQAELDLRSRISRKVAEKFTKPLSRQEIDKAVKKLYQENKVTEEEFEAYINGKSGENIKPERSGMGRKNIRFGHLDTAAN